MATLHEIQEKLRANELTLRETLKSLPEQMAADTALTIGSIMGSMEAARRLLGRDIDAARKAGDRVVFNIANPAAGLDGGTMVPDGGTATPLTQEESSTFWPNGLPQTDPQHPVGRGDAMPYWLRTQSPGQTPGKVR